MYVAKPYLNSDIGRKVFDDIKDAVKYLEDFTGIEMSFEKNKRTGKVTYDWELIGKLFRGKK